MVDNGEHRRMIEGHGMKGKHYNAKFKALQNLAMITNFGWQNLPSPWSYTLCSQHGWLCHIDKKWPLS